MRRPSNERDLLLEKPSFLAGLTSSIPARYVLAIWGFLGFANIYALRVNLNVAMVAMVRSPDSNDTNTTIPDDCPVDSFYNLTSNTTIELPKEGEFLWSEYDQGIILGAFFYGYAVTQIPGGRLAEMIGGKWLFGIGVLITSVLTILTPVAARLDKGVLITLRILEGLGEGVTYPAMHAVLARWSPKTERGLFSTIIYSGAPIGTVIAMPLSGILCDSDFLGGWPSVFYVFGTLGCIWFVFWIAFTYQTPAEHPRISKIELLYIQESQADEQAQMNPPIPWRAILTSVPVWILMVTHFGQNWGFYTLLTELPTYMKNILHFDIKKNGYLSALPYLLQAIVGWVSAWCADWVRKKNKASASFIRKFCNTVSFIGPAICLLGVTFAGCNGTLSVALFALSMAFNGFSFPGYVVTHVDMSPDFAGTLMGMTNCVGNFPGFMTPYVVGVLTNHNQTLQQWDIVFYISIAVYVITSIAFVVFGSAELQPWGLARRVSSNGSLEVKNVLAESASGKINPTVDAYRD